MVRRFRSIRAVALGLIALVGSAGPLGDRAIADQNDPGLDDLFAKLLVASNRATAQLYEDAIWRIWLQSGDPALDARLREGVEAMRRGRLDSALQHFDAVIERAPDYAEGWNKRATLHFVAARYEASIADVERTLALEPRHFGALSGLGQIHDALGAPDSALDAYERALDVHPHLLLAARRVEELRRELGRQSI